MMQSFFQKIERGLEKKRLLILFFPIIIFPICVLLEIAVVSNLIENLIVQFLLGAYFILFIPLYPIIIFPGFDQNPRDFYCAERIPTLFTSNIAVFVIFSIFSRFFDKPFQWLDIFLFSTLFFCSGLIMVIIFEFNRNLMQNKGEISKNKELFKISYMKMKDTFSNVKAIPKNYVIFLILLVILGIFTISRFPGILTILPYSAILYHIVLSEADFVSLRLICA